MPPDMPAPITADACAVCGVPALAEIEGFGALARITSDCRPFPSGGRLRECTHCGAVQKAPTAKWREEIGRIYAGYVPYHQAEGAEQIVLDSATGTLRRRSEVILSRLADICRFTAHGNALDVGCGSGATLKVMSRTLPGWGLHGLELDSRDHAHLHAIPGVRAVYDAGTAAIDQQFDLITSIHALEHFDSPAEVLSDLRRLARDDGWLFIQTPNLRANPFDLLVADHFMHFSPAALSRLVRTAGFTVVAAHEDWVSKEISLLARAVAPVSAADLRTDDGARARRHTQWLAQAARRSEERAAAAPSFGIFGTSIAATWFAGFLGDAVDFFVDEDPLRQQQRFMGKPVYAPDQVLPEATVLLALAPHTQVNVRRRLEPLGIRFICLEPMS